MTVCAAGTVMVGESLTGLTVMLRSSVSLVVVSLEMIVNLVEPLNSAVGVKIKPLRAVLISAIVPVKISREAADVPSPPPVVVSKVRPAVEISVSVPSGTASVSATVRDTVRLWESSVLSGSETETWFALAWEKVRGISSFVVCVVSGMLFAGSSLTPLIVKSMVDSADSAAPPVLPR